MHASQPCPECEFIHSASALETREEISSLVTRVLPALKDIQVLVPVHKGECGRFSLNGAIRNAIGQPRHTATPGDRVIQMKTDKERGLLNGEIGIVARASEHGLAIRFEGHDQDIIYGKNALAKKRERGPANQLDWAYAITVHKSQGSEFPVVIVPVLNSYSIMLARNLYYTAISRAREKVIIVGEPSALEKAARCLRGTRRITKLAELLNPGLDWSSRAPDMRAVDTLKVERKNWQDEDNAGEAYFAAFKMEDNAGEAYFAALEE